MAKGGSTASSKTLKSKSVFRVENVVVTSKIAPSLNLLEINKKLDNTVYEPGKFPALRIKKDNIGFLLYSSGKIVCTGSKTPEEAMERVEGLRQLLEEQKIKCERNEVFVRNIVASADLKRTLRLHELAYHLEDCEYNPEYFPGMKVRKENTRLLVFRTGKVILPGLRKMSEVAETVAWLDRSLQEVEEKILATVRAKR